MLDASTRIDVLNLLGDLKSRGLGVLFITHDLSLGNYISDMTADPDAAASSRLASPSRSSETRSIPTRGRSSRPCLSCTRSGRTSRTNSVRFRTSMPRTRRPPTTERWSRSSRGTSSGRRSRAARRDRSRRDHAHRRGEPRAPIPWQDPPAGERGVVWRSSRNPIIPRNLFPSANSIFNGGRPVRRRFAGVFRCDDTAREMQLHAGFSDDGDQLGHRPAAHPFLPQTTALPRSRSISCTATTRASAGSRTATTSPGATATTARRSASAGRTTS